MSRIKDLLDVLKVEVEVASVGLRNLLANPSGDLGAWAWATGTGVLGSGADGGGAYLEFTTAAFNQGPYSEFLPVTAGQYVSATWYTVSNDALYMRAWFYFYDASNVQVGAGSIPTPYSNAIGQRFAVPPVLVPAGAVTCRLVFQPSATSGGSVPAAGKRFRYRQAIVATAATALALGPVYTNLVPNPSFETNTTGWQVTATPITGGVAGTGNIARVATGAIIDAYVGRLTRTAGPRVSVQSPEFPVTTAAKYYRASLKHGADVAAHTFGVRWYNAAHTLLGDDYMLSSSTMEEGLTVNPRAGAAYARIFYETAAVTVDLDGAMMLENGTSTTSAYFDGATPDVAGVVDYSWTGTPHASASTKSLSALPYIPPITYQEIQGSAVSLGIQRRIFDGTLSITIRDAALDPATASLIRPGRACRVSVLTGGTWVVLFQGKVQRPAVDYGDLKRKTRPTITLTAYGPGADLAGIPSPLGQSGIGNIPALMEGVRVPFKVNGSTSQVVYAPAVSSNDQASVLDQVILTRDSAQGYAWITKDGILQAASDRTLDYYGTGVATFDESDYTTLGLSWDPETVINMVSVILLTYNATTGDTEETTYGPYVDQASFREWGPSPAEFRVHGAVDPATFAASVLAANAAAVQRVDRLRVPITDTADLIPTRALIDIMAKAHVVNTDRAVDLDLRVQGVDHTITWPKGGTPRWYLDLLFTGEDQVAAPIETPPAGVDGIKDGVWQVIGSAGAAPFSGAWVDFAGGFAPSRYMRKNGITYIELMAKSGVVDTSIFVLPAGFRPSARLMATGLVGVGVTGAASTGTAHTHALGDKGTRFEILANGQISTIGASTNSYASLVTSFPAEA